MTVNGMPVILPKSYSGSGLVLENIGLFVSLSSRLGVTLLWDGGICIFSCQFKKKKLHLTGGVDCNKNVKRYVLFSVTYSVLSRM